MEEIKKKMREMLREEVAKYPQMETNYTMMKNNSKDWKTIEEEFRKEYVVKSNAGTGLLRYTDADKIIAFFKPYFQEKMHELSVSELEIVDNNLKELKEEIIKKSTFESGVSSNGWYQIYKDDLDSII